jgi:hypothetical protein
MRMDCPSAKQQRSKCSDNDRDNQDAGDDRNNWVGFKAEALKHLLRQGCRITAGDEAALERSHAADLTNYTAWRACTPKVIGALLPAAGEAYAMPTLHSR